MKKIKGNKGKFKLAVMVIVAVGLLTGCAYTTKDLNEQSVLAINWVQTSAEYRAISYQAYNLARMNLDNFLASYSGSKPVAISVDIDEVVFYNSAYQAWLVGQDFGYSSETWGPWIASRQTNPMPGAIEFLNYAKEKGVVIFYISNIQMDFYEGTEKRMKELGIPYADKKHLLLKTKTSDKQPRRDIVAKDYEIALLLGDNLNDFLSVFRKKPVVERSAEVDKIKDEWGRKFIVFPNPQYGDWVGAIYKGNWGASAAEKDKMRKDHLERWDHAP